MLNAINSQDLVRTLYPNLNTIQHHWPVPLTVAERLSPAHPYWKPFFPNLSRQ